MSLGFKLNKICNSLKGSDGRRDQGRWKGIFEAILEIFHSRGCEGNFI